MLNLQIHLSQRLLHVLYVLAGHLDQIVAMPHDSSHGAHIPFGPECRAQRFHRFLAGAFRIAVSQLENCGGTDIARHH